MANSEEWGKEYGKKMPSSLQQGTIIESEPAIQSDIKSSVEDKPVEFKTLDINIGESKHALIRVNEDAIFELGPRNINTILNGLAIKAKAQGSLVDKTMFQITLKLADNLNRKDTCRWTREEIEMVKELVLLRMKHCEEERDQGSNQFNPDTYIEMKHLLLDLQLWLSASIIKYT